MLTPVAVASYLDTTQHNGPIEYGGRKWAVLISPPSYNVSVWRSSADGQTFSHLDSGHSIADCKNWYWSAHVLGSKIYIGYARSSDSRLTVRHFDMDTGLWGAAADASAGPAIAFSDAMGFFALADGAFRFIHDKVVFPDQWVQLTDYAGGAWSATRDLIRHPNPTEGKCYVMSACMDADKRVHAFAWGTGSGTIEPSPAHPASGAIFHRSVALDGTFGVQSCPMIGGRDAGGWQINQNGWYEANVVSGEVLIPYKRSDKTQTPNTRQVRCLRAPAAADPAFTDELVYQGDYAHDSQMAIGWNGSKPCLLWRPNLVTANRAQVLWSTYSAGAWSEAGLIVDEPSQDSAPIPSPRPAVIAGQCAFLLEQCGNPSGVTLFSQDADGPAVVPRVRIMHGLGSWVGPSNG